MKKIGFALAVLALAVMAFSCGGDSEPSGLKVDNKEQWEAAFDKLIVGRKDVPLSENISGKDGKQLHFDVTCKESSTMMGTKRADVNYEMQEDITPTWYAQYTENGKDIITEEIKDENEQLISVCFIPGRYVEKYFEDEDVWKYIMYDGTDWDAEWQEVTDMMDPEDDEYMSMYDSYSEIAKILRNGYESAADKYDDDGYYTLTIYAAEDEFEYSLEEDDDLIPATFRVKFDKIGEELVITKIIFSVEFKSTLQDLIDSEQLPPGIDPSNIPFGPDDVIFSESSKSTIDVSYEVKNLSWLNDIPGWSD